MKTLATRGDDGGERDQGKGNNDKDNDQGEDTNCQAGQAFLFSGADGTLQESARAGLLSLEDPAVLSGQLDPLHVQRRLGRPPN